jgi:hypothetical protein
MALGGRDVPAPLSLADDHVREECKAIIFLCHEGVDVAGTPRLSRVRSLVLMALTSLDQDAARKRRETWTRKTLKPVDAR